MAWPQALLGVVLGYLHRLLTHEAQSNVANYVPNGDGAGAPPYDTPADAVNDSGPNGDSGEAGGDGGGAGVGGGGGDGGE